MRLGLIARADDTGLGHQCLEFYRAMRPDKTLVVDVGMTSSKKLPTHTERYPGAQVSGAPLPLYALDKFLTDLDVVYVAEAPYHPEFYRIAHERGIATVAHINWEFFDENDYARGNMPDVFALPSVWAHEEFPFEHIVLPVPVATDRFAPPVQWSPTATDFLHVVGHPATRDRNGTLDVMKALRFVQSEIVVTMRCQQPGYLASVFNDVAEHALTPRNVTLRIDSAPATNYWDLYHDQQVLVMPRRYGGLCLPAQEAVAAGMPVIMPDLAPNQWLPPSWRIPAIDDGHFEARRQIDLHRVDPAQLAEKIDAFATSAPLYEEGIRDAACIAEGLSWESLRDEYENVFKDACGQI